MVWNRSPINLSHLLDAPAGKHGFLGVKKDRFVFEDGTEIRFWGTVMSGSACFPEQEKAPEIAERLAKFGFNLVRFKNWDAPWAEPTLFVMDSKFNRILNPVAIDRLDFFLYQLKNRGIYAYFDGLDSRIVHEEERIPGWRSLPPGIGPYIHFDPDLQSLLKQDLMALWQHRNRYTEKQYRDSPSIVLTQLFLDNHVNLDKPLSAIASQRIPELWNTWSEAVHEDNAEPLSADTPESDLNQFFTDVQTQTHTDLRNFLRNLSVKIPIAGSGLSPNQLALFPASFHDFCIQEGYWNEPFGNFKGFYNRKMLDINPYMQHTLFSKLAYGRMVGKPFIVSEWGNPWPNQYRAELPVWMAAMACSQDWQGCVSSPYHSSHISNGEAMLSPIETFNDPCIMGLMPAAALLFYQNEIEPARHQVQMTFPDEILYSEESHTPEDVKTTLLVHDAKVESRLKFQAAGSKIFLPSQPIDLPSYLKKRERANFCHDVSRGLVIINTPQTQGLIGALHHATYDDLADVELDTKITFGVVCVNSLDGKPINESGDIWITIVSKARNSAFIATENDEAWIIQNEGRPPVLIKENPVRLFINTSQDYLLPHVIGANGDVLNTLPFQLQDGKLSFRAGTHRTIYYRLSSSSLSY